MAGRDIPIHTIGFGSKKAPPDAAVLDVATPPMILKTDQSAREHNPEGQLGLGGRFQDRG